VLDGSTSFLSVLNYKAETFKFVVFFELFRYFFSTHKKFQGLELSKVSESLYHPGRANHYVDLKAGARVNHSEYVLSGNKDIGGWDGIIAIPELIFTLPF
jgi:hypothetical protein